MQQAGCAALFYLSVPVENGLSHVSVHRLLLIIASWLEEYDRRNSGNIRSKVWELLESVHVSHSSCFSAKRC